MIFIEKSCYLKAGIDSEVLRKYGFMSYNNGKSYWFDLVKEIGKSIAYYDETRRFVIRYPGYRDGKYRHVLKYIKILKQKDLIEIRKTAIVVNMNPFTNYRNWPDEKREKWEARREAIQAKLDAKYFEKKHKRQKS